MLFSSARYTPTGTAKVLLRTCETIAIGNHSIWQRQTTQYIWKQKYKKWTAVLVHCIKNENKRDGAYKIWRYTHFHSPIDYKQKKQLVQATLTKLHKLCNDDYLLYQSGMDKLQEFIALHYPPTMLANLCSLLAVRTRNVTWFKVRQSMLNKAYI